MQKYPRGIPAHIDRYQLATELYYWENDAESPDWRIPRRLGIGLSGNQSAVTTTFVITTAYYPKNRDLPGGRA